MTEHDPLCPASIPPTPVETVALYSGRTFTTGGEIHICECRFIRRIRDDQDQKSRADERARIKADVVVSDYDPSTDVWVPLADILGLIDHPSAFPDRRRVLDVGESSVTTYEIRMKAVAEARADMRERIAAATGKFFADLLPPYLFPENESVQFPTMSNTTINEAIREIWRFAGEKAEQIARNGGRHG